MARTDDEELLASLAALRAAVMFLIGRSAALPDGDSEGFNRRVLASRDVALRALSADPANWNSEKQARINKRAEAHLRALFDNISMAPRAGPLSNSAPPKMDA